MRWVGTRWEPPQPAAIPKMTVNLIDIHHAKDVFNLALTHNAGYRGIIHKLSEGIWFVDPSAVERCEYAWSLGFVLGGYHFFRSNYSGNEQAYYFLKALEPIRKITSDRMMPPWLDLETTDGVGDKTRMQQVLEFLRIVNIEFKLPGVYSSAGFWHSHTGKPAWIKLYWQWLAQWTSAKTYTLPIGWTEARAKVWQYGIAGRYSWCPTNVPGIRGQVDVNRFLGTIDELHAWASYGVEPSSSASPSAPPSVDPRILEMLDLMLKADINLNKSIDLARQIIETR